MHVHTFLCFILNHSVNAVLPYKLFLGNFWSRQKKTDLLCKCVRMWYMRQIRMERRER